MFGFIADILTSITSILFPIFASYKALRTSDPAVLTPWLMYWTTLSLFLLVESQFNFILSWIPFYAWIRLGVHLYLVLPGKQGSVYLYQQYIHPFLEEHERQIDRMITEAHVQGKAAGMDAIKRAIDYIRVQILGGQQRPPTPPPSRNESYSTYLMNRFAMPSAREGFAGFASSAASAAGTADLLGLLGKSIQQRVYPDSGSRDIHAADLAASGDLIPPHLVGDERDDFVNTQRDRLKTLLQAYESETYGASSSGTQPRGTTRPSSRKSYMTGEDTYMTKSKSESEFEDLGYEPMPDPDQYRRRDDDDGPRDGEGGKWSNWVWGNYGERDSAMNSRKER